MSGVKTVTAAALARVAYGAGLDRLKPIYYKAKAKLEELGLDTFEQDPLDQPAEPPDWPDVRCSQLIPWIEQMDMPQEADSGAVRARKAAQVALFRRFFSTIKDRFAWLPEEESDEMSDSSQS